MTNQAMSEIVEILLWVGFFCSGVLLGFVYGLQEGKKMYGGCVLKEEQTFESKEES
jgi:hypothetical protein